ncbi:MAG: lysophospholipid acyltransferase family protein [Ignavibacterium sp.]|nr:lysophospholipid acyltransferase family protein [Ignavibacterium sp.]MDW8375719.1 lysophospholipid acyltransferase family protein [Ignavibacteriales bacterium]
MIKADHKIWANTIFNIYLNRLLKKYFNEFIIIGETPIIDSNKSLMILPNHFSWWDGFFIYKVIKNFTDKSFHIMMLETQLKRYWFFQKLGAYSINQNNPKSVIESLNYTIELLNDKSNLTVIYPQGEIQPQEEKNIIFNKGVNFICEKSKSDFQILPVAFRIIYTNKKLPYVLYKFGEMISSSIAKKNINIIKSNFESNLFSLFDNNNLPKNILIAE